MIINPLSFTTASARRYASMQPQQSQYEVKKPVVKQDAPAKPLQPVQVRELILKPMFIALLAVREAERLRYICFDGTDRFKRGSNKLAGAIRDLTRHLSRSLIHAEDNQMKFIEFRFYEDTKEALNILRLNVNQYIKSLNPDFDLVDINAQSEVTRFLARTAVEITDAYVTQIVARTLDVPLMLDVAGIEALVAMQKACIEIEKIASTNIAKIPSKAREKALGDSITAAIRTLERTPIAQTDKFTCCGVCKYYTYEVAAKGHCKFPLNKASQMRQACKRFKRISDGQHTGL